jgi:hypothetical protein
VAVALDQFGDRVRPRQQHVGRAADQRGDALGFGVDRLGRDLRFEGRDTAAQVLWIASSWERWINRETAAEDDIVDAF